jgi:hypothetical protein
LARLAIVLDEGAPSRRELRLGTILDFFGLPWERVEASKLADMERDEPEPVVFGLAETVATVLKERQRANRSFPGPSGFYTYIGDDRGASERGLQSLCGDGGYSLREAPAGNLSLRVSSELSDVAGPMAGLEVLSQLRREDALVVHDVTDTESACLPVISAGGALVSLRFQQNGVPVFFCASSYMVDIDQTVGPGSYDVKEHFCSVVSLVMFLRLMFPGIAWGPQELGACLIVDDPLLRRRYGACDFGKLRDLMLRHEFTTNIAFIPWNWRRTSPAASDFFRNESPRFSVSVHGCDHIGAEFGASSHDVLDNKAKLAQTRMRNHEARTGIHHDPIMIFPQGVFSSACPEVLKRNGFLAAVNTEVVPVDPQGARTRIRDVWDVAIMAYGDFPVFTRRYAFHGLENFAFDLLLGKPCLVVSHHDFFKDGGSEVVELIEKLRSLTHCLRWRPLGEVIRRACRRRVSGAGVEEVEMYGNELLIYNSSDQVLEVGVRKREAQADLVAEVRSEGKSVIWTTESDHIVFGTRVSPHSETSLQVVYRQLGDAEATSRPWRFELSVAARRMLSEFRDDYLSRSSFLSNTTASLRNVLTRSS